MPPEHLVAVILGVAAVAEGAAFALLCFRTQAKGYPLLWFGLGQSSTLPAIFLGVLLALCYCFWAVHGVVGGLPDMLFRHGYVKLIALVAALAAALFEETLFRGFLMNILRVKGRGPLFQVIVSGVAFGLAHGVWGMFAPAHILGYIAATTVLGLALACVFVLGKRSLTPVILSHFLIDAVLEPWLLLHVLRGS